MCKGFIKMYCENFTFIHSSTKQHISSFISDSISYLTIFKDVKELLHIFTLYSVLIDTGILDVEGGNVVPNLDVTY